MTLRASQGFCASTSSLNRLSESSPAMPATPDRIFAHLTDGSLFIAMELVDGVTLRDMNAFAVGDHVEHVSEQDRDMNQAIAKAKMPSEVEKEATKELRRLERMPEGAAERFAWLRNLGGDDKARLLATIKEKGLWVSAEKAELREAEGWLFTKYSRRAAGEA